LDVLGFFLLPRLLLLLLLLLLLGMLLLGMLHGHAGMVIKPDSPNK